MTSVSFNCTPTFKLYHHRFCGLGLHPRTDSTVFRANIQKKGKYYKRNLFGKLEDALQWLIDATPIYIEEERLELHNLVNQGRISINEELQKDIEACKARLRELEKFLADVFLQQKLYLSNPLSTAEIQEAMRLWRDRDFSLAGRITVRDRTGRRKVTKKRRRSSSGSRSKANKKSQNITEAGVRSCIRCYGVFNLRSSSAERLYCRSCDNETPISKFQADPTPLPSTNVFKRDPGKAVLDQFSLNELPQCGRSDDEYPSLSFKSFQDSLPALPLLNSAEEFSPPLQPESVWPMNSELSNTTDSQVNIFDLLNDPIVLDSDAPSQLSVKIENSVLNSQSSEPQTPNLFGLDLGSVFLDTRASFASICLDIFSRSMYNLLTGDLKGFVQRGAELLEKIGEYIEFQEGAVINNVYDTDSTDSDVESLQLWNQAVHSAKIFREFEVSGTARRSRHFQLDQPEMYEAWNKGYHRVLSYLQENVNQRMEIITVNYQSPGSDRCQKEMAHLVRLPEPLLYQFLNGMESCGLRSNSCLPFCVSKGDYYYFNYRRFSRPQIGLFESFGVGPNLIRMQGEDLYVFLPTINNWLRLNEENIIKKICEKPAFTITREMERYHNPESSYQRFEQELYEILFRDVIKLE